jgi:hypothetical protein
MIYSRPKTRFKNNKGARIHLVEVYNKIRDTYKYKRELDELSNYVGFERPRRYVVKNLTDVNTTIKTTGGQNNTGFIISDGSGVRTSAPRKVYSTKTNMSIRYLIDSALMDKGISIPKGYTKLFALILKAKADLLIKINSDMAMTTGSSKEEIKRRIKGKIIEDAMMTYFKGETANAKEVLQNVTNYQFLQIIRGKYWSEFDDAIKEIEENNPDIGELLYG